MGCRLVPLTVVVKQVHVDREDGLEADFCAGTDLRDS